MGGSAASGRRRRPNPALARARRAAGLTQQDLADAVHRALCTSGDPAVDGNYISKLERGVITRPQRRYREALKEVLGAATDAELGFALYPRPEGEDERAEDEVRRVDFLTAATALGLGAVLGDPGRWLSSGRIGRADVDLVRGITIASRALRAQHGGAACSRGIAAQVDWAVRLLDRPAAANIRDDITTAVGAMASMAAWGEVDGGDHRTAARYHRLALLCADGAQDGALRAEVWKDTALAALYTSDPRAALVAAERATADAAATPRSGRVLVAAARIRVLSAAGRGDDAGRALDDIAMDADGGAGAERTGDGSGAYFAEATAADLRYEVALAAVDLAVAAPHRSASAVTHVERCLDDRGLSEVRRARMAAQLARVHVVTGDLDRAIGDADRVRSRLHAIDLRRLRSALASVPTAAATGRGERLAALLHRA